MNSMNVQAPTGTVWLNVNEFPEGPPAAVVDVTGGAEVEEQAHHFAEFDPFYATVAKTEGLSGEQVLVGEGSSEALHCAVEAFTSPKRLVICGGRRSRAGPELAAAEGHALVKLPLTSNYTADVKKLVEEAAKAKGGLIYI